jgi:type VI secretion system protein ImpI
VRDSLDVFLRCFIPLRDGYRQFKTDMDIRGASAGLDTPAGRAQRAVDKARNPRGLGELLLQWEDNSAAAHKAVEGAFADLMIHQLALLSGVMKGVKALVEELSPAATEKALEELQKKGKTGWTWGPYKYRELWKLYKTRHGDVSDGEKQLYQMVFGTDFARAYGQLLGEASAQGAGEAKK